jgi:ABC-2 type transport system ATP-binding protein
VYPSLTARDNLRFFADLAGLRGRDRKAAMTAVAEALQLTELLDRPALHLSGGERRRLHTAIALVHRPQLVMLDEPTTGADVRTRAQLLDLVGELAAAGSAVVYSTHYLGEVEQLDASVVVIDRGRVIARGAVAELVAAHAANVVEMTFAGPAPAVTPVAGDDRIECDGSVVRVHTRHSETVPALIEQLGHGATRLRRLDVRRPSLEAAFLELTGRRFDTEEVTADVA